MLIAARRAQTFVQGLDFPTLQSSDLHEAAVVRQLEIIGEAAGRVSQAFRDSHPEIPWSRIVGMRHPLIHDYRNVDLTIVWDVVQNELEPLKVALLPLIPPDE
ncbi:MAG: DUF86 domain-containing protein [Planctomycetaceae bacterium]